MKKLCLHKRFRGHLKNKILKKTCPFREPKEESSGNEEARSEENIVKKGRKTSPANHIAWINLVFNNKMHWVSCLRRFAQKSYVNVCSTRVTIPGLSIGPQQLILLPGSYRRENQEILKTVEPQSRPSMNRTLFGRGPSSV